MKEEVDEITIVYSYRTKIKLFGAKFVENNIIKLSNIKI